MKTKLDQTKWLIKKFNLKNIFRKKRIKKAIRSEIAHATSMSELWNILFSKVERSIVEALFFDSLYPKQILPTEAELSEPSVSDSNVWFALARHDHWSIFFRLLCHEILPSSEALSVCCREDNTHAWYWVAASHDSGCTTVLQKLLEKNVLPTLEALSVISSRNTNAWYALTISPNGIYQFKTLLDRNVLPTSKDLSLRESKTNTNVWYWLAAHCDMKRTHWAKQHALVFMELLEKNILPTKEDLSIQHQEYKTNVWYWLAATDDNLLIFQKLIQLNILPTPQDLAIVDNEGNVNVWQLLADRKRYEKPKLFVELLQNNIVPASNDLSFVSPQHGFNAWYLIASNENDELYEALLKKNLVPTSDDLAVIYTKENTNTWWWFSGRRNAENIYRELFQRNIFPTAEALSVARKQDYSNAWFWLALSKNTLLIFAILLDKNIFPTTAALSVYNKNFMTNAWDELTKSHSGLRIFNTLIRENILPPPENVPEQIDLVHITQMKSFNAKYNVNSQNKITYLLTQQKEGNNTPTCYGFLYIFYLINTKLSDNQEFLLLLPLELWIKIGEFILPGNPFNQLQMKENRSRFFQYHLANSKDKNKTPVSNQPNESCNPFKDTQLTIRP